MLQPKRPPLISSAKFIGIAIMTVVIFLIVDLGRRATTGYYVSQAEKKLRAEIATEQTRQTELKLYRDQVQSDEFVEQWARQDAHWIVPGDRPLILVPQPETTTPATPATAEQAADAPTPTPTPAWHAWWRLFLDSEPGQWN